MSKHESARSQTDASEWQNTESMISSYRTYRGLPALAGLGGMREAVRPGLSVEESVGRLKRHHYVLRRLHQVFVSRLTAEPVYELKMAFSYHAYLCAEMVTLLRNRVGEMREPPLGLDKVPHACLELLMDEVLGADGTWKLLRLIYGVVVPEVRRVMRKHQEETHVLADQVTRRILRQCVNDLDEMLEYGGAALEAWGREVGGEEKEGVVMVETWVREWMEAAGGLDGTGSVRESGWRVREGVGKRYEYEGVPRRDERFQDPYNMGVNAEVFLYDPAMPVDAKVLMLFYKRLREIDVPEMMASIMAETPGKPWGYYRDMTRQLWDEARHAMMGEVGFVSVGVDWAKHVRVNFTWSLGLNTQLSPKERHAVLYFIEQGLMPRTGKRHEWEVSLAAGHGLAATFQDFDWADEVLHARVGRDWYVSEMGSVAEAVAYGDACWSRVMMGWSGWKESGLTRHENWWPATYLNYCAVQNVTPDARALSFSTTYESTRADLKHLTGSA